MAGTYLQKLTSNPYPTWKKSVPTVWVWVFAGLGTGMALSTHGLSRPFTIYDSLSSSIYSNLLLPYPNTTWNSQLALQQLSSTLNCNNPVDLIMPAAVPVTDNCRTFYNIDLPAFADISTQALLVTQNSGNFTSACLSENIPGITVLCLLI